MGVVERMHVHCKFDTLSVTYCLDIWDLNHISRAIVSPWWDPAEFIFVGCVIILFWLKILAEFTWILSILKIITNENYITFYLVEKAHFVPYKNYFSSWYSKIFTGRRLENNYLSRSVDLRINVMKLYKKQNLAKTRFFLRYIDIDICMLYISYIHVYMYIFFSFNSGVPWDAVVSLFHLWVISIYTLGLWVSLRSMWYVQSRLKWLFNFGMFISLGKSQNHLELRQVPVHIRTW